MKKGLSLIEVVVSIAVASMLFVSILVLLNLIANYQTKRESLWKANKLIENIHAEYLSYPEAFLEGSHALYFDDYFKIASENNFSFKVDYALFIDDGIYHLTILDVYYNDRALNIHYDLGKWVKS